MRSGVLGLLASALAIVVLACNRTPDELPSAAVRSPGRADVEAAAAGGSSQREGAPGETPRGTAVPGPAHTTGRCVTPTPPVPARAVSPEPAMGCPDDPERGRASSMRRAVVRLEEATKGPATVQVEVAANERDSERGLMYRVEMPEDHGMLFDLHERRDHTFWMHNTCLPLDLLFIDVDGLIVGIGENAPTLSDDVISVGCPSTYVLEVNAGWSRRHGVMAGQRVVLP